MRRLMILSACIVGVLAAIATNALATPEIARCVSQPVTGRYADAGCTVKARVGFGRFELEKGAEGHLNFTATSGEPVFQGASGVGVVCLRGTATGVYKEVNGKINSVEHVVWTLTGCQLLGFDAQCDSTGQAEETIVSHELKGKLGYLAGQKTNTPRLGLQLEPSDKRAFAEFDCGGGALTGKLESVKGHNCVISELTPPNTMSTTISQVFETEGERAKQKWTHFEPTPTKTCQLEWSLDGDPRELVGQVLNQTVTSEIPLMAHGI
jgi:hypothetical protein